MPFDSALTSGQLDSLRGTSSVAKRFEAMTFLSVCPSTNVYTGRINQATISAPVPELITDGGSGTIGNVRAGMRVLFSHTSDRNAYYYSTIVRDAVTATLLKINPAGAVGFVDNDYYFIVNDYPAEVIYPRSIQDIPVPGWDLAWRNLRPMITNLPSVVAGYTSAATLSKAFAPTVQAAADGATISTYLWEVPSGVAFTSGSSSTQNVTLAFDAGTTYWVHLTVTDSNSISSTFHIHVWAHNDAYPPELLEIGSWELECSVPSEIMQGAGSGFNGRISAFDGADTLLDKTLVCIWQKAKYNGTETNIGSSGNILFVGRFRDEENSTNYDDFTGQQDGQVSFTLEGPLTQLVQRFPPIEMLDDATPTDWNQIDDCTIWRVIRLCADEYSTFTSVHGLGFDSIAETYRIPGRVSQGGDLLNSLADFAMQINAVVQANAAGMVEVARRGVMIPSADRAVLPTIANFDKQDYRRIISLSRDYVQQVGVLFGDGGSYSSAAGTSTAFDVQAPAGQPGNGPNDGQLPRQVLASDQAEADQRTELSQRAGHALAAQQSPRVLRVVMADGYHGLTPAVNQWYTWTLAANETTRGRVYTTATRWWLRSIRLSGNPETGEIEPECEFVEETSGEPGQIIDHPILDLGPYPGSLGELIDLPNLPPTEDIDSEVDLPDFGALPVGAVCSVTKICSACSAGKHYIDGWWALDGDGPRTIKTVTINYTATAAVTAAFNVLQFRLSGEFFVTRGKWKTASGTNSVTFNFNGSVVAEDLRVVMYGDYAACGDSVTLNSISVTYIDEDIDWVRTYDLNHASWPEWTNEAIAPNTIAVAGAFVNGTGWTHSDINVSTGGVSRGLRIKLTHAGMEVKYILVKWRGTSGDTIASGLGYGVADFDTGSVVWFFVVNPGPDNQVFFVEREWEGPAVTTGVFYAQFDIDAAGVVGDLIGNVALEYIELRGRGSPPDGGAF